MASERMGSKDEVMEQDEPRDSGNAGSSTDGQNAKVGEHAENLE